MYADVRRSPSALISVHRRFPPRRYEAHSLLIASEPHTAQSGHHFRRGPLRSGRNLAKGERFLRTPWNACLPDQRAPEGRGEVLQPLPGCVSLFLFYPGVRLAHPRLSSFRPAGADFGTAEAVPSRSGAMNVNLTDL